MKKKIFFACVAGLVIASGLSGCILKKEKVEGYVYENKGLGFSFVVPIEFEYYHFQQKAAAGYVDLEAFSPTADTAYAREVSGYAKFVTIRVIDKAVGLGEEFKKLGENGNKSYGIRFWQKPPADWADKWNKGLEDKIVKSFKTI